MFRKDAVLKIPQGFSENIRVGALVNCKPIVFNFTNRELKYGCFPAKYLIKGST